MKELRSYIKSQININDDDLNTILSNFVEQKIPKERFVSKEGHVVTNYFFIESGGLRIYYNCKGKQATVWVALENSFFTDISSLRTQTPSQFNIQAIENTVLFTITQKKMELLYKQFTEWQEFGRLLWESAFIGVLEGVMNHQTMTAEERYLIAMKKSELLQRVPRKHLSSYLGITPTSLSRLRRKVK